MSSAKLLVCGVNASAQAALLGELAPALRSRVAVDGDDLALLDGAGGNSQSALRGRDLTNVSIVAFGVDAERRTQLLARGQLVYGAPRAPHPADLTRLLQNLLAAPLADPRALALPAMDREEIAQIGSVRRALARGAASIGASRLRLHLAADRRGALLCVGPQDDVLFMNPHGDGLAAYALRCGESVIVANVDSDPRSVVGIDYHEDDAGRATLSHYAGARAIGLRRWQMVVSASVADVVAAEALIPSLSALLDAICDSASADDIEARYGVAARVYRPAALRARAQNDAIQAWPRFTPAWIQRTGRYWRWPLVLAGLSLLLPVAPDVDGVGEITYAGAPLVRAPVNGEIVDIAVQVGAEVAQGQVLFSLSDASGTADLAIAYADYRALLRQLLWNPQDDTTRDAIAQAWERVNDGIHRRRREIVAPVSGHVLDVPLVAGRAVTAGETLAAIVPTGAAPFVELDLPARERMQLVLGAPGWLRMADGREYAIRLDALGSLIRADAGPERIRGRATFIDASRPPPPGSRGVASLELGRRPLLGLLWHRLNAP
ncbi:MAG: HlyD family efflux transporter periplasmic adaptor subunit [Tahibacter sp.]